MAKIEKREAVEFYSKTKRPRAKWRQHQIELLSICKGSLRAPLTGKHLEYLLELEVETPKGIFKLHLLEEHIDTILEKFKKA